MKIIRCAVTHPVTVWMLTLAAVVFGTDVAGAARHAPAAGDPLPERSPLQTEFPGTAPVDVENLVTRPLEEAVGVVPGPARASTRSARPACPRSRCEFDWGTDMDYAALDVREKLDLVRLPEEARVPRAAEVRPGPGSGPAHRPVGRHLARARCGALADDVLKQEIEALQGVAAAQVEGGLEEEIRVEVDEARLSALGVSHRRGRRRCWARRTSTPRAAACATATPSTSCARSASSRRSTDIGEVTVGARSTGGPIRLAEVATVTRTHKERTSITHVDGQRKRRDRASTRRATPTPWRWPRRCDAHLDRLRGELPAPHAAGSAVRPVGVHRRRRGGGAGQRPARRPAGRARAVRLPAATSAAR